MVLVEEANQRIDEKEVKTNLSAKKKRKRSRKDELAVLPGVLPCDNGNVVSPNAGSPVPSLMGASADDPPVLFGAQHQEEAWDRRESWASATSTPQIVEVGGSPVQVPTAGTGAVIAAVAALCQLSASSES